MKNTTKIVYKFREYVNTLMVQDVLADDGWAAQLTEADRRGLTPAVLDPRRPLRRGQARHEQPRTRRTRAAHVASCVSSRNARCRAAHRRGGRHRVGCQAQQEVGSSLRNVPATIRRLSAMVR